MSGAGPRYRILRRLGRGGMAEVFEAELVAEHGFSRKVAVKRMLPEAAADPAAARRFLDEARIASRLHHANIVAVLDVGTLDDLPFQVLEYVDGLDAEQLLARAGGALPVEVALILAADVAHALDHAHAATDTAGVALGIVHRDVKPSNLLVAWTGDVKLGDFGIAVARERATATEAGIVPGTRGFMAPEQRTRSQLDGRTDVFALGLTLHALLTGRSPLASVEAELAILAGAPLALDPAIPADVAGVLGSALAPARLERPTAGELAAALGGILAPRLMRDPKSYLRGYLTELARPPTRGGALDQLLGIEIEPVPGGADHELRTVASPQRPPAPRRRRRAGWIVALIGLAALSFGVVATWKLLARDAPAVERNAVVAVVPTPDAAADVALPSADAWVEVPIDAAPAVDAGHVRTRIPPPARPAIDAGAVVAETGIGYLQVTGDTLVRAKILVDGKLAGYVPNLLEVRFGHHRVEAIAPDGTRRGPADVDITSFHTLKHPLHLTW